MHVARLRFPPRPIPFFLEQRMAGWLGLPYAAVQEPPPFHRQSLPCVSTGAMRAFARVDLAWVDRPIDHSLSRLPIACASAGPETNNNQHRPF
ncbi:hypothetical protein CGRA01v4_11365 [Colletotrichum graminicola]|nr:hypothetical protein CGRA01v4_11365 [Colletotrichum graminicola]